MTIRRAIFLLVISTVSLCVWSCWRDDVAHNDFKRLLTGDKDIELRALEIELQGKRIVVDDSSSMGYLSKALRLAKALRFGERGKVESSSSYDLTVRLSTGARVRCVLCVPQAKDHITLFFPIDSVEDGVNYSVSLPEPVPKPLSDVHSQLMEN